MKMYIWLDVYPIHYGGTMLFAVAENEEQAREVATAAVISRYGHPTWETLGAANVAKLGKPTRVLDVPCAEVYEWSE